VLVIFLCCRCNRGACLCYVDLQGTCCTSTDCHDASWYRERQPFFHQTLSIVAFYMALFFCERHLHFLFQKSLVGTTFPRHILYQFVVQSVQLFSLLSQQIEDHCLCGGPSKFHQLIFSGAVQRTVLGRVCRHTRRIQTSTCVRILHITGSRHSHSQVQHSPYKQL